MNLSDMAREIERRRPGTLPKSVRVQQARRSRPLLTIDRWTTEGETDGSMALVNDLAQAILRDAMVQALVTSCFWIHIERDLVAIDCDGWKERRVFTTGDTTDRIFAAFCAAFPEAKP